MSNGPVRALSPRRFFTWRTAFLALSLLLSTFALPPFLGLDSPLGPAGAVVNQGNAGGCRAYGTNWTACPNAFLSDDQYAYANGSAGSPIIQRVAATTDSADASSWSFSHTTPPGSNRLLLLAIATDNGEAVSGTPQHGSTSFALITTLVHSTGKPRVTLYGLIAPTVGAALVTGNLAGTDRYTAGAISYTGVHQTMPGDNLTTGEGSTGTTLSIMVGSEVGDLVVDFTADIGQEVPIVGAGQTQIYNEEMGGSGTSDHRATSSEETGASSVVMSRSNKEDGKEWVSVGLNLNVAISTTGLRSPTNTGDDYSQWTTPSNSFARDDQYAVEDRNGQMQDYYHFTFGIPGGATVTGIEFQVEGHDPDWSGNGILVELSWNGGITYTSTGNFVDLPDGADTGYQLLGGPADTWGRTWTLGELSNGNFRSRIEKDGSDFTFSNVDHIRMQVYYILPPVTERDTVWRGFGFALNPADEVQVVEVGIEWWRNNTAPTLDVTVSWDGGTTWAANQTATNKSADDDTAEWLDFTSATAWNASKLRDSNLRVRVGTGFAGARLDYVTVRTTYNDAPEIANLRLQDTGGQSLAGGLLDPTVAYRFLFNVTDEDGWADIGTDGAVGLRMWYDGNVTPELTWAEQLNGSDYRVELRYLDLTDSGNATLDEWSVVEGNAQYNTSASVLSEIYNGPRLIGYEFDLSFSLDLMVKAASKPTNATPGAFNDPDSWNVEALVSDGSVGDRQPRAASGEHMEFGVFAQAFMAYSASVSPATLQPGDSTVFQVDFDNTGQGPASRLWVNVTFPAELTYLSDDAAAIGGIRTCCESFEFTDVSPGGYAFNITASADAGVANGTVVWTNFTYEALDAGDRPINQSAEDVSVTIVNAVMSFVASASPSTLQPGDTTVFRVDFTNAGQGDGGTVWVNVTLPAELGYVSDDAAAIGGVGTCCYHYVFTNVAPGTYSFNVTAMANGGVVNGTVATTNFTLEALGPAGAPLAPSSQDVDVTIVNGILSYAVAPADTTLNPGAATVFQVTFTNAGDGEAGLVYVNMTLAPELAYVSDDAGSIGGITLCCYSFQFASVPRGTYTFNITVRANGGVANGTVALTNFTFEAVDPLGTPLQASAENESITILNAAMGLVVAVDPSAIGPGGSTTFQVTFSNAGLANASVVWVNVTLPPELVYVGDDAALIGGVLSGTYSFEFTDVIPGPHAFNLTVSAVGGVPNGTVVLTSFVLEALDLAGASLGLTNVDVPVVLLNGRITYAVAASPTDLEPGDTTTFTIWLNNTGLDRAERVWVNVTLPAGLSYVSDTAASIGGVVSGTYAFEFSTVLPGAYSFLLVARVDGGLPDGTGLLTNFTFEAVDSLWEPFPPASQDVSVTVQNAILDLAAWVDPAVVWPGAQTTFQVNFTNSGQGRASMVWINVTLPPELSYISDDAAAIGGVLSGLYTYEFADVAPGPYTFNLTVAVAGGVANGTVVLTRFAMEGLDPAGVSLSGETRDVSVTLANAVLALSLGSSGSVGEPADPLTFTATVTNLGAAPAESVTIEGSVDANATYTSSSGGSYDAPARLVRWNLATLGAGSQLTFQWTVLVDAGAPDGATVLAQANVESLDTNGTPLAPEQDSLQVAVTFASFAPVLVVTPLAAERGDEILATVYYNNTGSGSSGSVWLNWTLNGHYQLLALTPPVTFTATADGFDVAISSVGSGPQRLDARLRVLRGLEDNLTMDLDIAFASTYRNGNPLDTADLTSATTLVAPAMELGLTTSSPQTDAGAALLLTVTLRNTGQAAASGWLNLTLPAGVSYRGDDGTFTVTETADRVSWRIASIAAGEIVTLVVTLTAQSELGLQSFRFAMEFTDGKGSPPLLVVSNAVSVQIGPGASTPPLPWMWLLLAALVGGIVLFLITRRLRRPSIEEVFVVHQNGVLIAHRSKTLTPDKDEDILAAMLSTVQGFIRDAFTEHEDTPVRGLQFDKFNILVEQGTHHYVALVFKGRDNGSLQARLHQLSDRIEAELGGVLAEWKGTYSEIRPLKGLLPLLWGKRVARERGARGNAGATAEKPPKPIVQADEGTTGSEVTPDAVRTARKPELRAWCLRLGLSDAGSAAQLRERLLRDLKAPVEGLVQESEGESGLEETPPDDSAEEPGAREPADSVEFIEDEIEAIAETLELEPEDLSREVPEVAPEDSPKVEVQPPFFVGGEMAGAGEGGTMRKKAKRPKKGKRGKEDKEIESAVLMEERAAETPVEEKEEKPIEEPAEVIEETVEESAPVASAKGPSPDLSVKQIWDAPKTQLREWCRQLGLDDTGPIMNLRLRLLSRLESA